MATLNTTKTNTEAARNLPPVRPQSTIHTPLSGREIKRIQGANSK